MAKGRIEAYDIISKEALSSIDLLGAKLKISLDAIDKMIGKGKGLSEALGGTKSLSDMNKLIEAQVKNLTDLRSEKNKSDKVNIELAKSQELLIKETVADVQARKDQKVQMEATAVVENKEAGYIRQLRAELKLNILARDQLKKSDADYVEKNKALNAAIDKTNQLLKDNSSAMEKQRMNIGNYRSALEGLPGPLGAIVSKLGGFFDAVTKSQAALDLLPGSGKVAEEAATYVAAGAAQVVAAEGAAVVATEAMNATLIQTAPAAGAADAGLAGVAVSAEAATVPIAADTAAVGALNKNLIATAPAAAAADAGIQSTGAAAAKVPAPMGLAATATKFFKGALDTIAKHPIILAISLIIGALAGLFKIFTSTGEGAKFLKTVMAEVGMIFQVVIGRIVAFGKGLSDVLHGKFKEGFKEMGSAVSGVGEQLANATRAAKEYVEGMSLISKQRAAHISEEAEENLMISKNIFLSKDKSKTDKERYDLLKTAMEASGERAKREQKFAEDTYQLELKKSAAMLENLGISAEALDQFIKLPEAEQLALLKSDQKWKDSWNLLKTDGVQALEEYYAKGVEAQQEYFDRNKRNISLMSGLEKEMKEDKEKKEKDATEAVQKAYEARKKAAVDAELAATSKIQSLRDGEIEAQTKLYEKGLISKEGYEAKKLEITQKSEEELIKAQIESLKKLDKLDTPGERAKKDAEIKAAQLKLSESQAEEAAENRVKIEEAALSQINDVRNKQLSELAKEFAKGNMSEQKYNDEKVKINAIADNQILKHHLETLELMLATSELDPMQRVEYEKQAADLIRQINEDTAKQKIAQSDMWLSVEEENLAIEEEALKELHEEDKKAAKEAYETKKRLQEATIDLISEAGNAIFEINNNRIEAEISEIEKKRDKEIEAAGDNKDAQLKINEKYDKEVGIQKTKQAKNDRLAAIFQIGIATAVAVMKALEVAPPAGFILAALAGALGAIQLGVVLSKKIPEYAKGTQSSQGGVALVGEEGTEVMVSPRKEIRFTPNKPTLMNLEPGTQIFTAKETVELIRKGMQNAAGSKEFTQDIYGAIPATREMSKLTVSNPSIRPGVTRDIMLIVNKAIAMKDPVPPVVNLDLDPVVQAIKNKHEWYITFKDEGIDITKREGDFYTHYKNNFKI